LAKQRIPSIFVSIAAANFDAIETEISSIGGSPSTGFELRLDYLGNLDRFESRLHQMLVRLRFPIVIATCRRSRAGGLFKGTIEEQAALLSAAVRAGCQWVDIEIESVNRSGVQILKNFAPASVIVSHHNYRRTLPLGAVYRRMSRLPARAIKIVGYARKLEDNLKYRKLLKAHRRRPHLVALALGSSGICSRLLALQWGSAFTFASPGAQKPVAAGQLPVDVMRSVYRVEHLDRRTQIFGVAGSRASMSLSPAMQNVAFQAKRVKAIYLPCETPRLADFLAFARALGFMGFSVTMPFKQAILKELDWVDPLAARIGACNTVAVQQGKWMGWNTDAAAVVEVLTKRIRLAGSRILILGAGGAARAAAYALRAEGAVVLVAARREQAARRLARGITAQVVTWDSADGLEVDAAINATPVGMAPHTEGLPVDLARLRARVVFDMVYYPLETRLLSEARGRGLVTISGLEMLVAQGARQFEIWTGEAAPRALMEQAVRQTILHSYPR
jgi:3-dehydroquinate dehydratase / shikimate dehydrogenase